MRYLLFHYINWKGEDHTYLVNPVTVKYSRQLVTPGGDEEFHWYLNCNVIERDGEKRPGPRSFILVKMRDVQEVKA